MYPVKSQNSYINYKKIDHTENIKANIIIDTESLSEDKGVSGKLSQHLHDMLTLYQIIQKEFQYYIDMFESKKDYGISKFVESV